MLRGVGRLAAWARPTVPTASRQLLLGSAARARPLSRSAAPLRLDPSLESIIARFKESKKGTSTEKAKSLVDEFGQLQRI